MNTNTLKSSILPSIDRKSLNLNKSDTQSLTLIQAPNKFDQPTQEQKKSIARIYAEQARIYFQEQNWQKAIAACKNALEIAPDTAEAYKVLGNVLQRQGRKAEALGVYAKALALNPNSAAVYANLGSFHAEQKNWRQALDYYQQAVILDPDLAGAYRSLAQIWEELGDTQQALECFCRAVNLNPASLTSEEYFSFGKELYQQGKIKEASIFYTQGVKLNPYAEKELILLVQMLEELEEWQQAVIYYQQLISLPDTDEDNQGPAKVLKPIKNLLSRSKSKLKSQGAIAKETPRAIPPSASNVVPHLLPETAREHSSPEMKLLSKQLKTPLNLLQSNSNIVSLPAPKNVPNPVKQEDSAGSLNNLGSAYAQKQQWAKAISCYQQAVQLDSNFGKSYRNLARVHSKLGDRHKAALYWYEAFTVEPDQVKPEEYFSLAKTLLGHQQLDQAIACLRRTIKLNPRFDQAYLILGKIFENQGKQQEAEACYAQIEKHKSI